jgi:hypothetical protein
LTLFFCSDLSSAQSTAIPIRFCPIWTAEFGGIALQIREGHSSILSMWALHISNRLHSDCGKPYFVRVKSDERVVCIEIESQLIKGRDMVPISSMLRR